MIHQLSSHKAGLEIGLNNTFFPPPNSYHTHGSHTWLMLRHSVYHPCTFHFPLNYWCQLQEKDLLTLTDSLCYFSCIQVLLKHAGPCWLHMQRSTLWRKLWRKGVEVKVRHSANTALCYVYAAIFSCLTVKINFSMVTFGKYKRLWGYCVE